MPIYEYRCKKCGHLFEANVSWSDSENGVGCPSCLNARGSEEIEKLVSIPAKGIVK